MDSKKFNKLLQDKYFLLKDIAQKYNYSEDLLNMLTFIYISFYMDFGGVCDKPLHDLFNRVEILFEEGTVNEISKKYGYGAVPDGVAGLTIFDPNFEIFKNPVLKQNPQKIILGTYLDEVRKSNPVLLFDVLIHELRHALMGYYNTNILLDENTYYMRSGLQESYYYKNSKAVRKGEMLDEITNTYITALLVNRILSFKQYHIENRNFKRCLDSIKTKQEDGVYRSMGYYDGVYLLYPILSNPMFINLINKCEFYGTLENVKEFIENNNHICSYDQFCELLDDIMNYAIKSPDGEDLANNKYVENVLRAKEVVNNLKNSFVKQR